MINKKIRYFLTLAECLSFTQAAAVHNVSQTAISQYIAGLEDRLGVKLFARSPHQVRLTEAGEYYYRKAVEFEVISTIRDVGIGRIDHCWILSDLPHEG